MRVSATSLILLVPFSLAAFTHPGLLHTASEFTFVASKVASGAQPWTTGFAKLTANSHSASTYTARPVATVYRGTSSLGTENYSLLFNDMAAAYALALRWKISGDTTYAAAAAAVIDAWSSTLTEISGSSDKFLAAGLYGFQFANAVEILRGYSAWTGFAAAKEVLLDVFYPMNRNFLLNHNGAAIDHYWANWDLCNIASAIAIGVVADNQTIYDEAIEYFYHGAGNGAIENAIWKVYTGADAGLAQLQESGRDQGHTMLVVGMLGTIAKMAGSQGLDLFGYLDNRILKGAEYAAKYNLGNDVPYTTYTNSDVTQTVIAPASRGDIRPIWELLYNQYAKKKGLAAPWTTQYAALVRTNGSGSEGGGGNYGPNSGGYDQLGYGTLMFSL
ncbi:chondroitin AC/alginate lyase [Morchella conica CCBAS932]|uniref:Chondroitin AC/alginate lyase n=1 Tax=Morchella conica CCBAS932 TaxID=1392247 RepID=A0A3N4KVB4_9PEZI|nr:chondroitin AC/alginate lyase [Morchella conica CCBAS932]